MAIVDRYDDRGFGGSGVVHAKGKKKARRGSYGIAAPYLLAVPALLIVWNVTDGILYQRALPFVVAALVVASIGCGLYTSRRGKFIVWDRLLDGLNLRGDERILDLGCGGRLIIADIFAVAQYRARLVGVLLQVEQRSLGWRMWWSGPWVATSVLTATKPTSPCPV
jgi:hypothetical protein